jgi:hypothetical protein
MEAPRMGRAAPAQKPAEPVAKDDGNTQDTATSSCAVPDSGAELPAAVRREEGEGTYEQAVIPKLPAAARREATRKLEAEAERAVAWAEPDGRSARLVGTDARSMPVHFPASCSSSFYSISSS